jgi:hypothetical protein
LDVKRLGAGTFAYDTIQAASAGTQTLDSFAPYWSDTPVFQV